MNCQKCKKVVDSAEKHLKCALCKRCSHVSCLNEITDDDYKFIVSTGKVWKCFECVKKSRNDETPVTPTTEKSKFILYIQLILMMKLPTRKAEPNIR